ncbi:MAG: fumarylacetoacetate hydrolase family protein [Saprospiraceae bacterium]|nr:fumarylacetoacetate hydrolase family protein [Saprospiraceae bacterium]
MKLIRFGAVGKEKPGIVNKEGKQIDVSSFGEDYTPEFFASDGINRLAAWLNENAGTCPVVGEDQRLGPPIAQSGKLLCIGLNYAAHAKESGMEIPKSPVLFGKATSAICGPFDDVIIPKGSEKTDWEVELAVVIGKRANYVNESEALDYIAGYMVHNDVSERAFQLEHGGQWIKGKSADTFAPLGPWLVTKDEVQDPNNLHLWLKLNGEMLQDSTTSDFVFNIQHLVSYLSQYMSLMPGDIISTGTPAGVGLGLNPQRYLKPGDVMELGVEGLGISKQTAVAYAGK